jgi:hypothetical protein
MFSRAIFGWERMNLLVTANVSSSLTVFTLMMEAVRSSETLVLILTTRRHIPEYGILHYADNFVLHEGQTTKKNISFFFPSSNER